MPIDHADFNRIGCFPRHSRSAYGKLLVSAEIASLYFAELSGNLAREQKLLTWGTLISSSGAAVLFVTGIGPEPAFLQPLLAVAAVGLSLASLVLQNQKLSTDAAELRARCNRIAMSLERLWEDVYSDSASDELSGIEEHIAEASKAGAAFRYDKEAMARWQTHVEQQRGIVPNPENSLQPQS